MLVRREAEALLAEAVEVAQVRERKTFAQLAGDANAPLVLFGAGGLGRQCLEAVRRHHIEPVAFADNNPRLWGSDISGVPILSPDEAVAQFGQSAAFVVTIWGARGAERTRDRVSALRTLGCAKVIPFGPLAWSCSDGLLPHYTVDLPHKVLEQSASVMAAFELWADERSRLEYVAQLKWRLWFDSDAMADPSADPIYFPPDLLTLRPDEVFVDCGAFDGDTLRSFLSVSGGAFSRYVALEPDPTNFAHLVDTVATLPDAVRVRVKLTQAAASSDNGTTTFAGGRGPSSHVGGGGLEVETVTLDEHLSTVHPTFVKMDIEGAEPSALLGGRETVTRQQPILAVSCYHRQDHLWTIPLLIQRLHPDYRLYLRPHDLEGWDLVCYAIPGSRLP